MCRVVAYLREPIALDRLLFETDSSLLSQSCSPRMMSAFRGLAGKLAPTCPSAHVPGGTQSETLDLDV